MAWSRFALLSLFLSVFGSRHLAVRLHRKAKEWKPKRSSKDAIYESEFSWTRRDELKAPAYARYWRELTDVQKEGAAFFGYGDEESWNEDDSNQCLDEFADSLDDREWDALTHEEKVALEKMDIVKWIWNKLLKVRTSFRPVSEKSRKPYKDMRKCTKWNVSRSEAFSEHNFFVKFGVELEVATAKGQGRCQQHKELRFENPDAETWAVYIYPTHDYNDAFCLDEWFCARALTVARFFSVAVIRVRSPSEATSWLKRQAAVGMRIGHLVFAGHGRPSGLQFGHKGLETGEDADSLELLAQAKAMLAADASVFLDSCLTSYTSVATSGEDESVALQSETLHTFVGRKLAGHHVWGSTISYANSQIKVSFDNGRFHAIIDECEQFCQETTKNKARSQVFANTTDVWAFDYGYSCLDLAPKDAAITTPQDCLKACDKDSRCHAFSFRPEAEDHRCFFSADCDATRAPEEILFKIDDTETGARILQENPVSDIIANAVEVQMNYRRGTSGTVWVSINREKRVLLDGLDSVIPFEFKEGEEDFIVFTHAKGKRQMTYWAKILKERPARTLVEAELDFTDGSGTKKFLLDRSDRYLLALDAIGGNSETRYKVDRTAPKYVKMQAEESVVFTFMKPNV